MTQETSMHACVKALRRKIYCRLIFRIVSVFVCEAKKELNSNALEAQNLTEFGGYARQVPVNYLSHCAQTHKRALRTNQRWKNASA